MDEQDSSLDEWLMETQRLELQGKQEQAENIRSQILKQKSVPWEVLHGEPLAQHQHQAIEENTQQPPAKASGLVLRTESPDTGQ
ncbi:MAG TPA: hypothetical protein ENG96_03465 [Gammaproteobacteria bacterium]|nr:hypothetical protein [Gammaproteobacteria bacterium]